MFKVFLSAMLALGAGGLTYSAAESLPAAAEVDDTDLGYDECDDEGGFDGTFDGDKGGKGGKGGFKGGKGGKKGGKGKSGKGKGGKGKGGPGGKGGPKGGKGPKGEE